MYRHQASIVTASLLLIHCQNYASSAWFPTNLWNPRIDMVFSDEVQEYLEDRIIGGQETSVESFPFLLSLEGGNRHICGGSILNENWALTAAHCVYDRPLRWLSFRAGSSEREKGGTLHPVKYYVYHEKYLKESMDYDVAVVFVKTPFVRSGVTLPVLLPYTRLLGGENVNVAGWGYLEPQMWNKPKSLEAVVLKTLTWEECRDIYPGQVTPRMMCAGDKRKDICNGDSGGPLILGSRQQVGIVSWAYKCGDGLPSVYTNVSVVEPWIRKTTNIKAIRFLSFVD